MTKEKQNPDAPAAAPPRRMRRVVVAMGATVALVGTGAGAGLYAAGGIGGLSSKPTEDPNRPKLVEREAEPATEESGEGEGQAIADKVGTVAVKSDRVAIDRKRFQATYFPIEQNFTANLADGSGFVQVGLSVSTYFDGKVIANLRRQAVPIRSAILLVLSDQEAEVLASPEGKRLLQKKLTSAINQVLRSHEGFGGIDDVYFTTLVIQ